MTPRVLDRLSGVAPTGTLGGMTVRTDLDIRPLSPIIGAEVHGIDIAQPVDDDTIAAVRAALNEHHVIFFRDQSLTPESQEAFASRFGQVTEGHPVIAAIA